MIMEKTGNLKASVKCIFLATLVISSFSLVAKPIEFLRMGYANTYTWHDKDGVMHFSSTKPVGVKNVQVKRTEYPIFSVPESYSRTVYRCLDADGMPIFTAEKVPGKECNAVAETKPTTSDSTQWIDYPKGSYGDASNPISMSFKLRDNKNPLWPSLWTKSTYMNARKPKDIATIFSLWNIDCNGNKIAFVQGQTVFKDGASKSEGPISYPTYRYAVPDTSDEHVIHIGCK